MSDHEKTHTDEALAMAEDLRRHYLRTGMARHSYDAGQMIQALVAERDAAIKKMADAPHDTFFCATWTCSQESACTCWKSKGDAARDEQL